MDGVPFKADTPRYIVADAPQGAGWHEEAELLRGPGSVVLDDTVRPPEVDDVIRELNRHTAPRVNLRAVRHHHEVPSVRLAYIDQARSYVVEWDDADTGRVYDAVHRSECTARNAWELVRVLRPASDTLIVMRWMTAGLGGGWSLVEFAGD